MGVGRTISFWDKESKTRLKSASFPPSSAPFPHARSLELTTHPHFAAFDYRGGRTYLPLLPLFLALSSS